MNAATVLNQLHSLGLSIRIDGEKLIVQPKAAITDEVRTLIRTHKPALLATLAANDASASPDVDGRIAEACRGLPISPEKMKSLLSADDFDDIRTGDWTQESMCFYAQLWASGKGYLH